MFGGRLVRAEMVSYAPGSYCAVSASLENVAFMDIFPTPTNVGRFQFPAIRCSSQFPRLLLEGIHDQ